MIATQFDLCSREGLYLNAFVCVTYSFLESNSFLCATCEHQMGRIRDTVGIETGVVHEGHIFECPVAFAAPRPNPHSALSGKLAVLDKLLHQCELPEQGKVTPM